MTKTILTLLTLISLSCSQQKIQSFQFFGGEETILRPGTSPIGEFVWVSTCNGYSLPFLEATCDIVQFNNNKKRVAQKTLAIFDAHYRRFASAFSFLESEYEGESRVDFGGAHQVYAGKTFSIYDKPFHPEMGRVDIVLPVYTNGGGVQKRVFSSINGHDFFIYYSIGINDGAGSRFARFDLFEKRLICQVDIPSFNIVQPIVYEKYVYLASINGVYLVDTSNCKVEWFTEWPYDKFHIDTFTSIVRDQENIYLVSDYHKQALIINKKSKNVMLWALTH